MTILKDGTSVICAGLDYWFKQSDGRPAADAIAANVVTDWRLEARLGVRELRTPPAAPNRPLYGGGDATGVGVPFLRFPLWHVCPFCRRLRKTKNRAAVPFPCYDCQREQGWKKPRTMVQVPLVAVCQQGHLQEFPWRAWLSKCTCDQPDLRLHQSGGTGLGNYRVSCKKCKKGAPLGRALEEGVLGKCAGGRPWFWDADEPGCEEPLKGALRNSANLYFSNVVSSVYLPRGDGSVPEELKERMESQRVRLVLMALSGLPPDEQAKRLFEIAPDETIGFTVEEWTRAIASVGAEQATVSVASSETDYRSAEYAVLSQDVRDARLRVNLVKSDVYTFGNTGLIESVGLVEDLVVTKALSGFARLLPPASSTRESSGRKMWKRPPRAEERWLPATQVRGEGIFIRFSEDAIREWENRAPVVTRTQDVLDEAAASTFVSADREAVSSRFILLHTFAHVLMNRLVFEAGYTAASLSERIYARIPTENVEPMAAVLIYTASGDSEGSLGGLVRLGEPGTLERLVYDAIEGARWCSNDPVCMELGGSERQGPDGLNLAACHACAHLPETACENFNVLLDRALLVGALTDSSIAYFDHAGDSWR